MNRKILALSITCIIVFFINLGAFDPDLMEARNFVTAKEMLQFNNWLTPSMNGLPRLEKPPFPTWLTALSIKYGGDTLFFSRLPAALAASSMLFFFFFFMKTLFKEENIAFVATLFLAISPLTIEMGRTGSWDIFCQALMVGAIGFMYKGFSSDEKSHLKFIYAGALLGLSFMSKGPVAFYGMLLPFLIGYFIVYKRVAVKQKKWGLLMMLLIGTIVSSWWFIYVNIEAPEVSAQIAEKEIKAWGSKHIRPFWFYLHFPVYAGIGALFIISSFFYKYFKGKSHYPQQYLFLLVWTLTAVFLLSIIPEKKERYLLPVLPPMCGLAGLFFIQIREKYFKNRKGPEKYILHVFSTVIMLFIITTPVALYVTLYQTEIMTITAFLFMAVGSIALAVFSWVYWKRRQFLNLIYISILAFALFVTIALPYAPTYVYNNPDYKGISEIKEKEWYANHDFYTDGEINLKAIWRIGKQVTYLKYEEKWPETTFVLISENKVDKLLKAGMFKSAEIEPLGTYDYFRKKGKFKLHVNKIIFDNN